MKHILILFTVIASTYGWSLFGDLKPGFHARYPQYYDLARSEASVIEEGWVPVERAPDAYLPSLKMYCPDNDYTFCTLFDELGYISGLQIALPIANFTDLPMDLYSLGFKKWSAPAPRGGEAADYYTTHQLFISEETLNSNATTRNALRANNDILYDGGIWIPHLDGTLFKINTTLSKLDPIWTRQACIPSMGRHYMRNLTSEGGCDEIFPWFLIFQDDVFVATGFVAFGNYPAEDKGKRAWFERPTKTIFKISTTDAPECLFDFGKQGRAISLHLIYVENPWKITCIFN